MGRRSITGLKFFPLETNFYSDRKILRLRRACGDAGIVIYTYILTLVYGENGYYLDYTKETVIDIANAFSYSERKVREAINFCATAELIDEDAFLNQNIITSIGIQQRYIEAIKKLDRAPVRIRADYLLVDPKSLPQSKFTVVQNNSSVNQQGNGLQQVSNVQSTVVNDINRVGNPEKQAVNTVPDTVQDSDGGEYHLTDSTRGLINKILTVFQRRDPKRLDIRPIELRSLMELKAQIGTADADEQIAEVIDKFATLPIFQRGGKFYGWTLLTLLKYKNFDMVKSGMFDETPHAVKQGVGTMNTAVGVPVDDIPF